MSEILDDNFVNLKDSKKDGRSNKFLIVSIVAYFFGFVFKIQHLPLSGVLFIFGSAFTAAILILRMIRFRLLPWQIVLYIFGILILTIHMFFRNTNIGFLIYIGTIVIYVVMVLVKRSNDEMEKGK